MFNFNSFLWCFLIIAELLIVFTSVESSAITQVEDLSPAKRDIDAKGILSSLASNFFSRGYYPTAAAGSQVVSLNLTNLLVLVLLKALIFAAGSIGIGHLKEKEHEYYGRSMSEVKHPQINSLVFTEDEILLYLEYLTGNHECLKHLACQQPEQAKQYADAGKLVLKASQFFSIDSDVKYADILSDVEQAVIIGENNGDCSIFICNSNNYT